MNLEQCKEICSSGWPSNQREQARFDAEQWLIQEVERLTVESDGNLNEGFNAASDYLSYSHSKQSDEIAKLRTELEGTRSVIIQHAIWMLNQIGLSGAEADEIMKRGGS